MTKTGYRLISCKGIYIFDACKRDAIAAAIQMEAELQPAFGVTVEDRATGQTVAEIRDGIDIDADETSEGEVEEVRCRDCGLETDTGESICVDCYGEEA